MKAVRVDDLGTTQTMNQERAEEIKARIARSSQGVRTQ